MRDELYGMLERICKRLIKQFQINGAIPLTYYAKLTTIMTESRGSIAADASAQLGPRSTSESNDSNEHDPRDLFRTWYHPIRDMASIQDEYVELLQILNSPRPLPYEQHGSCTFMVEYALIDSSRVSNLTQSQTEND